MARNIMGSAGCPTSWLRRVSLWTAAAGLAVLAAGGAALAGTAAPTTATAQIKACYQPGSNPSVLKSSSTSGQ